MNMISKNLTLKKYFKTFFCRFIILYHVRKSNGGKRKCQY
jgi:hypothetical protein